jgi:membrane protein DedA with SNARE-associated domain
MNHLIEHYGYAIVVLLVGAEGIGLPLPGETALLTAAALSARGHLSLPWVILAAACGVAIGGCGGYWIGRTGGTAVVTRYGKWVGINTRELDRARSFFERHGIAAVFTGRFLPVIRILTGIVAGITAMPFKRFAAVNAVAGVVWSILFGVLGYEFSRNMFRFEHEYGRPVMIIIVILGLAAFGLFKWYESRSSHKNTSV